MAWRKQLRNPKTAGRAMMNVGGMQRYDQSHGYYTPDMSMRGGAMYNKGGRVELKEGGGVGIQTHGNKLARALNTKTPDHSKFLNEYGYLKGGVPVKNG